MRVCSFLCSDSSLYFFIFLSILHGVYTRDCSCIIFAWHNYNRYEVCDPQITRLKDYTKKVGYISQQTSLISYIMIVMWS